MTDFSVAVHPIALPKPAAAAALGMSVDSFERYVQAAVSRALEDGASNADGGELRWINKLYSVVVPAQHRITGVSVGRSRRRSLIGPKKLSTIRRELEAALAKHGATPIEWLDQRIRETECKAATSNDGEVLRSLRRFLASGKRAPV